jgi:general secretion pathway protein G
MRRCLALALVLVACGRAEREQHAREVATKHDLFEMRKAIDEFRADKHRGPHSLEELTATHYLHTIPKDPLTNAADWRVTTEAAVHNDDFATTAARVPEPEIIDVHSRAPGRDAAGKLYSEY